jgi:hypothetical protein
MKRHIFLVIITIALLIACSNVSEPIIPTEPETTNVNLKKKMSVYASQLIPTDGLVAYYPFNENVADESGNGNDGTACNVNFVVDTPFDQNNEFSLNFPNELAEDIYDHADSYVTIPDNPTLRLNTAFTISALAKMFEPYSDFHSIHVIAKQSGSGYHNSYIIWWDDLGFVNSEVYENDDNYIWIKTDEPTFDEWHHFIMMWDGNTLSLFIDGVLKASGQKTLSIAYDNNPVIIGADDNDGDNIPDEGWYGNIDEVRIYNRVLSTDEIGMLYSEYFRTTVQIDIKPGSDINPINLKNKAKIPVGIITTIDFDATKIDPTTVQFGPGGANVFRNKGHVEDINNDGVDDIVFHFITSDTGIEIDDTKAYIIGETVTGIFFKGSEPIRVK